MIKLSREIVQVFRFRVADLAHYWNQEEGFNYDKMWSHLINGGLCSDYKEVAFPFRSVSHCKVTLTPQSIVFEDHHGNVINQYVMHDVIFHTMPRVLQMASREGRCYDKHS